MPGKHRLIFLVDDDEMYLKAMKFHLTKHFSDGIEVHTFPTGEECIESLDQDPSIIVLDYHLDTVEPDAMSGKDTLKRIKSEKPDLPVVMLSGQERFSLAAETIIKGAYIYIVKDEEAMPKISAMIEDVMREYEL